ncbi:uncharacterized protein LOC111122316 isoform X13 [Crassostrea virginica]
MANFFTSASTNFVLEHQLSPRRLSSSSHHVEFRDMPRRLSAHVEFRDLPCSHIDGHLQPPPHLYHRRRSSDVSHDRRHHHHHHKESDGNTSFLRAARDGNLQEVLEYLTGSTDINTSNPNGLNALHLASKEGHIDIVQELLKRGANVEAATKKGNTALHIASLAGHLNIVKLLVDNGAKFDVQAHVGFTPLYMAAQEGHADVVKYLLTSGANQSLSTKDGFTPLAVALQQGHERVVSVLLENDTKGKVKLPALHVTARKDDVKSAALLLQNEQNNVDGQTKTGGLVNDTTKSGFTPLHIAAHYGNTNVGSLLIQRGADVNFKAKNNITPLHVASRWGKPTMVTLLLDNKAIVDERTRDGLTPLHCAARSGHENVVDLLMERGAPKSAKTKNGLTPLHMAAQGDHVDCARLLLYHKAPVDDVTVDYLTPLHVAAHCGNVKTAKLLLDRKCDPNSRALNGFTPLHIACKKNRIKVVELLLKYGATIEATTESGLTPLHVASFMGHMNIVIYLIQNNANPDFTTVRGETALHLAARANQTDIIRILLRNGATVDARAREQQTPLHIAARLGNVDNVTLLLQLGAAPDAVTKDLYTPLHIAAKEGHEEVAAVLLEHGASHGLTTKKGFTPLHIAAKYGNIKVARLLLQKDANPDCQGKNGLTPLHVATHYNHVNVALLLLDNKASPHSIAKNGYNPLHIAAKKNQMDIATTLLEFGARPDAESKNGFTPLHLAAQEGHTDMVSLLLEHKADVNSKAHNGLTSLHLAAQEDKVNVAEVLVKYGTEIDPQTKAGYTPLHTACHFGQMNMVRFLLEQGASVSATTKLGYTPLHQAAQQGHVQVINLLLKNKASPNAVTNNGQTALSIAQRLGYISVVDTLTPITEVSETLPSTEDKIKLMSPEIMQENPISDSDDEGVAIDQLLSGDDFLPSSPLFGKPLTEQHVYLPFYEGNKMQSREDSISLGEKGGSISPLDTSYEKDVSMRSGTADARPRITSEIGTSMRYPSYLERGPDYEAEMRYFSGDSLMSPRDKSKDSVFGGDYSTLDRLDTTSTNSESKVRVVDEHGSEIDYDDDIDDRMKKNTAANQFTEDFYLRQSVRYGAKSSKRAIYPSSGYKSQLERPSESYAESYSIDGIDLNDEFKYMPDDSVPQQDYCEAQIMTSSYAAYTHAAPPETHLGPGVTTADKPRVGSYSGSSFSASFDPDNVAIDQTPAYSGRLKWKSFLISFMVDARGGAMRGRRHSGIRIIIPPNRASMPTRVTCRLIKKDKLIHPIPIGEGEALAARIIEMGPVATKFLGRILIEIPHFASLRGKEREIKIMRSTNGDKWEEHPIVATDDAVQKALSESMEDLDYEDELAGKRVTRILTDDFPRYFALVTKVREEKQWVGEEGLILSSTVVPQVQAVFPKGAVNKNIKVGLQAQPVSPELVSKLLGNRVAVSPIVTLEPRRRRFHTAITLTIPVPKAAQKGMINQYENEAPTLRVMYSIAASNNALREGTNPALWDDLTDQTQLTFIDDCVSFNTNVSGRFMLMDCQNVADACRFATELYREAIIVPYMARFVVFAKRTGEEEGKLRMFCMTDDRIDKTLEKQENFREVARSRDVEVLEGRPQYVEMAGNLIPITKSGDQLYISFKAFRENRLPCLVKIRDRDQEPAARVAFMKEPKVVRGELPQTPICNLNIALPDMSTSSSMEMDPEAALELKKRSSLLREHGIVVEDTVTKAKINLSDVADTLKGDWVILATQLDISGDEIHKINSDYRTVNDQALAMLSLWKEKKGEQATGNELERALRSIKREDVVQKCMYNVECITDEVELAAAKVAMDQSGFDTFAEEIGATQDSMKRNMSLDVQFDEQEVQKESESVADSPASAPQAYEEDTAQSPFKDDLLVAEVSERRALAKEPELPEKKKEDFFDLIDKLDKYNEIKEKQERSESSADTGGMDDSQTITEEELTSTKQEKPKSEEIIAKVEELGQNLAPTSAPAPAPEPTEDEEGTKTPPPSPVEGEFVSEQEKLVHEIEDAVENSVQEEEEEEEEEEEVEKEETIIEETFQESDDGVTWRTIRKTTIITPEGQTDKYEVLGEEVRAQQAAVNELAARLSTAEETAEHPGETEKHEEVIDSQMVQTSESAARQTTMDVGETDVDTGLPYVADQKEPDMGKLVESLRTDLYEKEKTEKSGNESDVSSIASSDTEGEFNIEPLPSTAPETVSKDPVADRRSSVERKRKRTDSLSSSSLSDVEDNGEESVEENTKVEKEPVKPKSSLHDGSRHEPKTGHVHFRKEDLPSSSSSSSSSSSTEDESNQIDTEAKSPDPATPKIDRMEEFHFAEKPGIERKEEKGSEDKGDIPVKVYKPSLTAQDTIEEGLKMLPDNIEGTEDVKPIADSDVEKQIVKAPAPPKEKESSSSSSSSDEDGEDKRPAEDFREGSVERIERYEEVPPKEQTHARSPTENQEPVQDQELLSAGGDTGDGPQFTKTAKRLKRMSSLQQQEVIDSELVEEEESTVEQVLTDGSKVTRKRFKSGDSIKSENGEPECMELVEEEGPEKEDVKYEENEEILEDGTVHRISRTRRQSLKHVKRTLISESGEEENIFDDDVAVPGKAKEDVIEVFEEPAKPVTQVEEVEVIKNDGRVVKKRMVMNRMVSNVKTFHQSFDDSGNLQEDEYEIEAIIPGTESAFVEGEDTTSSSSSASSSDDNDENDEEIDVDDLDLVEEDCQSGTTVTSRQVIKQTFTSTTYETVVLAIETPLITITEDNSKPANEGDDHLAYFGYRCSQDETELWIDENDLEESLKEEENSKSVAEIVHMFEKDSQKQNATKPDIVQISGSDELSEGKVSNIKEQSAMYFAEKEIIIVEKNKSEVLTESQNEYTQDDTKPVKVHRMVEIFEKISSQSSVDETGVERQLLYDNSNVGFESMSEQNKDIEAEKTQSVDEVDERELEILGESEETTTKNQMREPETQQEVKKPDELKYTNISQEFGIVEETTSPLVIETVSPVAKIVEDIESNVSRIQEATIKEQVVPTEQVTEVHTKDLEPQYLSSSDEIYYEKIVNVSEETQFADEIVSSTEEMLEEFEQCYPNKMNATETVENEEKCSSEKDTSPECEQKSVVETIYDQNEVSEEAKEPSCSSSLSIQIVEQHSDEQLIEEEYEMNISKTEVQKISPTSNLEDFSAIESRSDDIETVNDPHTDKEFPPKHDGELSVEETGYKIRTGTTGETSIINDFQIVHALTEISNEQQKEEKHDTMENQDSDTSFEYPLTLQNNEEHDARETRPETHLQQMSVSHDEYEFIDDTNERLPKDVDEIKCVDDEGDEDWELLDKEEIEEALNYPDKEISYSDVGSSEQAFNISSEHPRPCIPVVDMNSESEDDISDDTTEIADRSETCDIESPIEFKQPFEKFEEASEPKTVQFDNKVLEVKSTSTGIESSVETRDIAKESVTSIEEEDIESISSTEEYKIRKYEYDQEIKEKDTIAKQTGYTSDQVEINFSLDDTLVRSIDTLDTDTDEELKTSVHEKHEYEHLSSQKLSDESLPNSYQLRHEVHSPEKDQETGLVTPTRDESIEYEFPQNKKEETPTVDKIAIDFANIQEDKVKADDVITEEPVIASKVERSFECKSVFGDILFDTIQSDQVIIDEDEETSSPIQPICSHTIEDNTQIEIDEDEIKPEIRDAAKFEIQEDEGKIRIIADDYRKTTLGLIDKHDAEQGQQTLLDEKELSQNSLSDEELVERPKRISISQDITTEEMIRDKIDDYTQMSSAFSEPADGNKEKTAKISQLDVSGTLTPQHRLESTGTLEDEDEEISVKDETTETFKRRIEGDILSTADAEMEGQPVDFVAHSSSDDLINVVPDTEDTGLLQEKVMYKHQELGECDILSNDSTENLKEHILSETTVKTLDDRLDDSTEEKQKVEKSPDLEELQLQRFEIEETETPFYDKSPDSFNEVRPNTSNIVDDAYLEATDVVGEDDRIEGEFMESAQQVTEQSAQSTDFEEIDKDTRQGEDECDINQAQFLTKETDQVDLVEGGSMDTYGVDNLGFEDILPKEIEILTKVNDNQQFEIQGEKTESLLSTSQDISDHTSAIMADSEGCSDHIDSSDQAQSITTSLDKSADLLEFEQLERTIGKLETVYDTFSESQILEQLDIEHKVDRIENDQKEAENFSGRNGKDAEMKESGFEDDAVIGELNESYIDRTERFIRIGDDSQNIVVQENKRTGLLPRETAFQDDVEHEVSSRDNQASSEQDRSFGDQSVFDGNFQMHQTKDGFQGEDVFNGVSKVYDAIPKKTDTATPTGTDERPLSPSSYTLETDMEGSQIFEQEEENAFDEIQRIEAKPLKSTSLIPVEETADVCVKSLESSSPKDNQCPPSPSEFTLVMSQDQDMLSKALGIDTNESRQTALDNIDQKIVDDYCLHYEENKMQERFINSTSVDDDSVEENSQETVVSRDITVPKECSFESEAAHPKMTEGSILDYDLDTLDKPDVNMETSQEFVMSHDPESLAMMLGLAEPHQQENSALSKPGSDQNSQYISEATTATEDTRATILDLSPVKDKEIPHSLDESNDETHVHEIAHHSHESDDNIEDDSIEEKDQLLETLPENETVTRLIRADNLPIELPNLRNQVDKLAKESKNVFSSYENVYEGVPLDPKINRLSLDASEIDVGDRFDTKQMDLHLHSDDRASSYEQVYAKGLADQSLHSDLAAIDEDKIDDKISSSSSEVAQHDDGASDEDAEAREAPESNLNETDVEEQFSPDISKHFPIPGADFQIEAEKTIFSVTDSPTENHSSAYSIESPDLLDKTSLTKPVSFTVGTSPSECIGHDLPANDHLIKRHTDKEEELSDKNTEPKEIHERSLICSYEMDKMEEEVVLEQSSENPEEASANLQNEYPDFESSSTQLTIDTSDQIRPHSIDEISPEDLEEKNFQFDLTENVLEQNLIENSTFIDEDQEELTDSDNSSETNELSVFDECSRTYVRIPWESAYQFRRQISETYEQNETEKKYVRAMKSIDMGSFFRRDTTENERKGLLLNENQVAVLRGQKKGVRFAAESVDIMQEDLKQFQTEGNEEPTDTGRSLFEPHEQIDKIHEMTVIQSIMEKRQLYEDEMSEEIQYQDSYTSTRDDNIEEASVDLQEVTSIEDELCSGNDSLTPTEEPTQFAGIIVTEAEPTEEKVMDETIEKDIKIRPILVGKFPMALPSVGKAIADNEIYESSETGGDTTEEKLSPIDETPQDDFPDEQEYNKSGTVEKHVTFQSEVCHLRSGSSDDLVKTSTSSSEMEPTILAASYDLESGRVSKVVATYDVSPDTVEKQFVAPPTAKAILSSPEDDVFELESKRQFESEIQSKTLLCEQKESDISLEDEEICIPKKDRLADLNGTEEQKSACSEDSASASPFEIMSPSELEGYDDNLSLGFNGTDGQVIFHDHSGMKDTENYSTESKDLMTLQITPKSDSSFDHSSLLSSDLSEKEDDSPFNLLECVNHDSEHLPDVVEEANDRLVKYQSPPKTQLPNGPTEVEFNPDIDLPIENATELHSSTGPPPDLLQSATLDDKSSSKNEGAISQENEASAFEPAAIMYDSQTIYTHSVIEELAVTSQDRLISSDQTLYGLEMPSEENNAVTLSTTQTSKQETDADSDSVNVTEAFISQLDEDEADLSASKGNELFTNQDLNKEEEHHEPMAEKLEEWKCDETEERGDIYHGKLALNATGSDELVQLKTVPESICPFETLDDEYDNVEEESLDTNLIDDEGVEKETAQYPNEQSEPFELDVDAYDLERPCTPTPVDKNQHFFDEEAKHIVENEEIEVQANVFVESVLHEACARVNKEALSSETETDNESSNLKFCVENAPKSDDVSVDRNDRGNVETSKECEIFSDQEESTDEAIEKANKSAHKKYSVLMKQISEDIPGITLTTHYHADDDILFQQPGSSVTESDIKMDTVDEQIIDSNKPIESEIQETIVFSSECIPEEPEDIVDAIVKSEVNEPNQSYLFNYGKVCIPEENEEESKDGEEKEEIHITSSTRPLTVLIPRDRVDHGQCISVSKHDVVKDSEPEVSSAHAKNEYVQLEDDIVTGYFDKYESDDSLEEKYEEKEARSSSFEMYGQQSSQEKYVEKPASEQKEPETTIKEGGQQCKPDVSQSVMNQDVIETISKSNDEDNILDVSNEMIEQDSLQDEIGDTSSVESFTTVVPVDQDDDEEGNNRMDDFASMSSSYHSDVLGLDEDEKFDDFPIIDWTQKDVLEFEEINRKQSEEEEKRRELKRKQEEELLQRFEELKSLKDEKDRSLIDWEEGSESSIDSDRYEYMDKTALSVITENSDEDKFEFLDNEDAKSEKSDRIFGSPEDFPPPSPGIFKNFNKSADRDDISITSSLLEFERLEHEILASGSRSSIENEKDNISVTSSLAEFERLERELVQSSSASSVEKITSDSNSKESDKEGSRASLNDVDKLEKDMERKESVDSITRRSETSSLASLNEFERLEQEMALADELEAEAQKIVSILESGKLITEEIHSEKSTTLMTYQKIASKIQNRDQPEEPDDLEDSLSEDKTSKKDLDQAEVDSLEGDVSELTSLTSSVILNQKAVKECDEDSLRDDEESMKISSDSLGEQLGLKSSSDKDKYDTDSLAGQEGLMEKSTDSLEADKKYITSDKVETDSLCDETEGQKQTDLMQTSIDSLDSSKSRSRENLMESSMYSVDSSIFSRSSVETMKSAGSQRSDSSTEIMQVSAESYEERKRREKRWLIDNYHSYRESGHGVEPLMDQEGNVLKSFRIEDNYGWDESDEEEDNKSSQSKPFSWGPYEEKKKIYTMAEWEAMKEEKRRASLVTEKTETVENISEKNAIVTSTTFSTKSISSYETEVYHTSEKLSSSTSVKPSAPFGSHLSEPAPQRIASIDDDDFVEYDVTEHSDLMHGIPEQFAQKSGPIYIDPEMVDSEEDEIVNYPVGGTEDTTDGAEGGESETHRLTMKKEIHTRTMMKDGKEQTFVHEEAQIEQEEDPPEELKDSMQQIIDQFMETPAQPEQYKALEHDV